MIDTEPVNAAGQPPAEEGIGGAVKALINDAQTLLEAEIAYRKAQASFGLGEAKSIGILLVLGLAFGFFTLLAIVVGLLLALAVVVGAWGALAIVGGVLALLCAITLWLALQKIGRAKAVFGRSGAQDAKAGQQP